MFCSELIPNFDVIMKKNLITLALALLICAGAAAQQVRYVDAAELNVIGKVLPTPKPFTRLDTEKYHFPEKTVKAYADYSTGLAVLFTTDSKTIRAKWVTSPGNMGSNMTGILQKGMDLYIKKDGEWVFAGVARPDTKNVPYDKHEGTIVSNMAEGTKECLLYLPMFTAVESLHIGIDEGASIAPLENPFRYKIVIKGSSVTHGASASRPGMSYVARYGRANNLYVCNLGFSGRSKLQKEYAQVLADTEADAFIFDSFSNPSAEEIYERFDEFVDIIRAAHPDTPLIFMQTERRESRNFSLKIEEFEFNKQKAAEEVVRRRMKTDKHMYFITSEDFLGHENNATVDGSHPSDLGFTFMLESITPQINKILKKYIKL